MNFTPRIRAEVAEHLRSARLGAGLSQADLARAIWRDPSYRVLIARAENAHHTPSLYTCARWLHACRRQLRDLGIAIDRATR